MRISSGFLRGRIMESPKNSRTHPMGERVRSGLFNTLGDINGLSVLDAFAGSGALGIEAISRGATRVTAIEVDRLAQAAIISNMSTLELSGRIKLIKASASAWLNTSSDVFDLVLLDAPYNNMQTKLLLDLAARAVIGGTVVISLPPKATLALPSSYKLLASKNYGDAELHFYKKFAED